jgi:L-lactate dehydrogenase
LTCPGNDGRSLGDIQREIENDIRYANITIIEGTGASQYGIGAVSARLAGRCCATSAPSRPWPPTAHVTGDLSLVSVLGAGGVQQMLDPPMTAGERAALENSAASLREAGRRILAVTQ